MPVNDDIESFRKNYPWRHEESIAYKDKYLLQKWADLQITSDSCINELARNNGWDEKPSRAVFTSYAAFLGYSRV